MASSSSTKMSMKLLIDTKNQRVLFAEASKYVIDFLFNLLCLPIGTVMKLISSNDMVGSLCNLYNVGAKNDDNDGDVQRSKLYMCPTRCGFLMTHDNKTRCYYCNQYMIKEATLVGDNKVDEKKTSNRIKNGFVKDAITFMVMDDLVIQPMSAISSITLLNKFNVKEIDTLQEKVVEMGMDEGIKLLKASLHSKMVLTSVFLKAAKVEIF
ncbi:hypothetical protein KIW84_066375 [Lathyrus oleraceus]|uniref:DUF674 domain-containing protein n=1 Tax=Pisum sativum TaxID=3888 RepID=A0A9D5A8I8_PEA|nr:hypothetical protein KIW84_066375 [Pisum sativum]